MAIKDIVTMGFGPSSVNFIPTMGYAAGVAVVLERPDSCLIVKFLPLGPGDTVDGFGEQIDGVDQVFFVPGGSGITIDGPLR